MTSLEKITARVQRIGDGAIREICARLLEQLRPHLDDHETMWSIRELSKLAEIAPEDPALRTGVQFLSSIPEAKLLDMHFLYFDPRDDDSSGEVMDDKYVASAYRDGFLVDPRSGKKVERFEETLVPFFQISRSLSAK